MGDVTPTDRRAGPSTYSSSMISRILAAATLICAALVAGCGGDDDGPQSRTLSEPGEATQPARPEDDRVIRAWAKALRSGDLDGAVAHWAVPARAQNGTPLLLLDSRRGVRAFNDGLTCGAVPTRTRRSGSFTIVDFRLVERRGGQGCGPAVGASARSAIRVRDGKITDWIRLPEATPPGEPGPEAPAPVGPPGPIV